MPGTGFQGSGTGDRTKEERLVAMIVCSERVVCMCEFENEEAEEEHDELFGL